MDQSNEMQKLQLKILELQAAQEEKGSELVRSQKRELGFLKDLKDMQIQKEEQENARKSEFVTLSRLVEKENEKRLQAEAKLRELESRLNDAELKSQSYQRQCNEEVNRLIQSEKRNVELQKALENAEKETQIFKQNYQNERDNRQNRELKLNVLQHQLDDKRTQIEILRGDKLGLEKIVVDKTKESLKLKEEKERVRYALDQADSRLSDLKNLLTTRERRVEELLLKQVMRETQLGDARELRDLGLSLCKVIDGLKQDVLGLKRRNHDLVEVLLSKI